jgi:hypothetical protein
LRDAEPATGDSHGSSHRRREMRARRGGSGRAGREGRGAASGRCKRWSRIGGSDDGVGRR